MGIRKFQTTTKSIPLNRLTKESANAVDWYKSIHWGLLGKRVKCNELRRPLSLLHVINGKIKKADITLAAHCHNVNVLLSNISLFDFCCFSSAS